MLLIACGEVLIVQSAATLPFPLVLIVQYLFNNDSDRLKHAQNLGYDLDSLLLQLKEVFSINTELGMSTREMAETFYRVKNVFDYSQGADLEHDIVVYENNGNNSTRLSAEIRTTGQTFFFRVLPGQRTDKLQMLTKCELCAGVEAVKRGEIKQHVLERHAFSGQ
jgi:hypothetical protein